MKEAVRIQGPVTLGPILTVTEYLRSQELGCQAWFSV